MKYQEDDSLLALEIREGSRRQDAEGLRSSKRQGFSHGASEKEHLLKLVSTEVPVQILICTTI